MMYCLAQTPFVTHPDDGSERDFNLSPVSRASLPWTSQGNLAVSYGKDESALDIR